MKYNTLNNGNTVQVKRQERLDRKSEEKYLKEIEEFQRKLRLAGIKTTSEAYKKYMLMMEKDIEKQRDKDQRKAIVELKELENELAKKNRKEEYELRQKELKQMFLDADLKTSERLKAGAQYAVNRAINGFLGSLEGMTKDIDRIMNSYSKLQTSINTRLQGVTSGKNFQTLQSNLLDVVGITPYLKTEKLLESLQNVVQSGIATNIEQRAFLDSISDKIASTYNALDVTLNRIVRVQQADSSAARLGMEAYLTRFLNSTFKNTEYLNNSFDTVTSSLVEAMSQMSTQAGVEFEYVVQKWLGSLSSVGLSDTTVGNLASAMSSLATGDITGLASSNVQNLVVMAASRVGIDYAKALTEGISIDDTNKLLSSITSYLQEIGSSANQVVKNQYAQTFGVSMADLRAAINLTDTDIKTISSNMLSYQGSIEELGYQLQQVPERMSLADILGTVTENAKYSLFSNIASNPALYATWKITDMIQGLTGGINIPTIGALGNFVDLNATVDQLMKLAIVGTGSLGMIGDIISGVGNTANFANALSGLGISSTPSTFTRGSGIVSRTSGISTSQSTYVGQGEGSTFYQSAIDSARREATTYAGDQEEKKTSDDIYNLLNSNKVTIIPAETNTLTKNAELIASLNENVATIRNILENGTISVRYDESFRFTSPGLNNTTT